MSLYLPNLILPPDDRQDLVLCIRHDGIVLDPWGNQIQTRAVEINPTGERSVTFLPDPETCLIFDRFIPCRRKSDNAVGVLDTREGKFCLIEGAVCSADLAKEDNLK